ncbi:MAG: MFS transporter [Brevibacterium sp.]|uniref:MFS transporter n=1 Tax=Brevibacterium sp. TaxID=1701 RepID=UPI003F90E44F
MSASTPLTTTDDSDDRGYRRRALVAAAVGYGLDGFDLLILSFALSGIIASFGLSDVAAGSLSTITLLGAVVGGIVFGALADRHGRVRVLTWTVLIFAVFTGLSALAQGYWDLAAYRFIAGIGIGGEFGIGMALAAEAVRADQRARATSWVGVGFQLGVFAAAIVSAPVIALWGWRALFVIGLVPAAAVRVAESLVGLGLSTSTVRTYAPAREKKLSGWPLGQSTSAGSAAMGSASSAAGTATDSAAAGSAGSAAAGSA